MFDLVEFAQEFVDTARKFAFEFPAVKKAMFTSRQSIAIASLGTTRILRLRSALKAEDLIKISVITTPPEAQKYAEYIALKIIYGEETIDQSEIVYKTKSKQKDDVKIEKSPDLTASKLLLQDILNFLNLEKSVDVKKDLKVLEFAEKTEEELFSSESKMQSKSGKDQNESSDKELLEIARRRIAFEIIGGRAGIITHNISSQESMFRVAKHLLLQFIPNIDSKGLTYAQILDYSDEIANLTFEKFVEIMSNLLLATRLKDRKEVEGEFQDVIDHLSQFQVSQGYSIMNEYRLLLNRLSVSENYYAPLLGFIINQFEKLIRDIANTIDDFLEYPNLYDEQEFDREKLEKILDKTKEQYEKDILELIKKSHQFDNQFFTNMSEIVMNKFENEVTAIPLEDLMDNPINNSEWMELFEETLEERLDGENDFSSMNNLLDDVSEIYEMINNSYAQNYSKKQMTNMLKTMASVSKSYEDLEQVTDRSRELGNVPPYKQIREKGLELGLSPNEIARLLGNYFEYLKEIIPTEDPSFERVDHLLNKFEITTPQFNSLTKLSIENDQEGALGALAQRDLLSVSQQIPNTDEGANLFERALGAGGGENLLFEWFKLGKKLPPKIRQIVKDAAKRVMIDLAKAKSAALIGSSEAGPLPEGSIRPYILGDDLDTIDIDESLDNILALGKNINDVVAEDFIVRKTVTGRRCVIFLIDISGSMSGVPLASASLAAAMLLMAFARDELGVALFESSTHVLCEINDPIEIDEVVDEILELTARGGTQMQRAIEWAENQFLQAVSQDKMFIMVTDAMIGDFNASKKHLKAISEMGATNVMILPGNAYSMGNIQNLLDDTNTQLVTVSNWKAFPEIVSEVLSRT
ncbi:MAG: VWA domain-containing protein [Candidatus Heimdallarchaeota archaeon]|nr:VWA domain-containing protein [Candidatus Heimdallarchaeota archaeon]